MASMSAAQIREPVAAAMATAERGVNPWNLTDAALDAIPNGWAKVDGEWVQLSYMEVNGVSVMGVPMEDAF